MKKFIAGVVPSIAMALGALISFSSQASNELTIDGYVTNQTCSATVNGKEGNVVVNLDSVEANKLKEPGSSAGRKLFNIGVKGCVPSDAVQALIVQLQPYNITGPLIPSDTDDIQELIGNRGDAKNVQLRLYRPINEVNVGYPGTVNGGVIMLPPGESSADKELAVEYVSYEGNAGPGSVIGLVQYAVQYY